LTTDERGQVEIRGDREAFDKDEFSSHQSSPGALTILSARMDDATPVRASKNSPHVF
jgi:hypothetical protein